MFFALGAMMFADVFGRKALGSINGVVIAMHTASAGIGPLLFGWSRDSTGTYRAAVLLLIVLVSVASAVLSLRTVPQRGPSKPAIE